MSLRNFCKYTTEISVRHTTEISVKLTSKADDSSYCPHDEIRHFDTQCPGDDRPEIITVSHPI